MEKTLRELAELTGGIVDGDEEITVTGVSPIDDTREGTITLISHTKYLKELRRFRAAAAVVGIDMAKLDIPVIRTANPQLAFAKIVGVFHMPKVHVTGIHESAYVAKSAVIGENVSIYPFVYIGENVRIGNGVVIYPFVYIGDDSTIGDRCIIYPSVTILERTRIQNDVIIHPGAVIGADGFGFIREGGGYFKFPQIGNVVIEDNVEIGANTCIDRASLGSTIVKKGTKIDNLVQIGHNVAVGENCIIVAQVGISGSTKIGKNVTLGGQVGVLDHIEIGDNVTVGAQSGITKDISPNQVVSGLPPMPHNEWLRSQISIKKLPHIRKTLSELEKRVKILEEKIRILEEEDDES